MPEDMLYYFNSLEANVFSKVGYFWEIDFIMFFLLFIATNRFQRWEPAVFGTKLGIGVLT